MSIQHATVVGERLVDGTASDNCEYLSSNQWCACSYLL